MTGTTETRAPRGRRERPAKSALLDGAELGRALATYPNDREAALAADEEALFPRSAACAAESDARLRLMFGDDALARLPAQGQFAPRAEREH
ncbi:hypothetical protein [Streptomyces noursei]|uniref:Uncharacterized protein n=1 Tax=Streptomyces noursei TaxID=1971 RepID=A0A2N8P841_STRNR|nr:hypothetical protein AOB60_22695 [Streptomyces noursei]